MNETLKIYNYHHELFDTEIPLSEVETVEVTIISGDEVVDITKTDDTIVTIDAARLAGSPRLMNFFDGSYEVEKDQLEKWVARKDSYDWFFGDDSDE